ncbi:Protein phosphatase 2C [Popillia japonica]|uniref:Protein phosphatase 2C n=1 Tax=Popillia japonica TaxID=7064 RepID=A0AAW1JTX9_POPJA
MKILNESLQEHYEAIKKEFDTNLYLNKLLQVALDENTDIQKGACLGFVTYIENRDTVILPHMNNLIEYMLEKTQSDDSELALQACEFWLACSKLPTCRNILMPYMEKLLPVLLKNMRYSEFEINGLKGVLNDDDHIPDKEEDIKPFSMSDNSSNNLSEEENNFDLLDSLDEPSIGWTLRKCSAASLDALSGKFGDDMLPIFVPLLNDALNSEDIIIKESGILALGAIAEGCTTGLKPHLPDLINYLMKCMGDRNSIVRVITCWTLSRYMRFITSEEPHDNYFIPVMMVLLKHFLDSNKRVQRAALSAFCVFQEEAGFKLVPYIDVILQAFVEGFKQYKFRSFFLLYDAITVLAQAVGNNLNKPQYVEWLMPPLMYKFNTIEDYYDDQFLALTECLSSVATALEIGFLPYAEMVFSKCLIVVNETVTACLNYNEGPDYLDPPDKEPICGAHDLLLAMAFGLKTYFVKFVTNSNLVQQLYYTMQDEMPLIRQPALVTNSNLVQQLYYTMQDEMPLIRQPALALFGEILCFPFISDQIHAYIPVVIENLDKRFDGACNNAAWVIGKLCLAMGKNIEPYLGQIFEHFVEILQSCTGSKAMYQTVAISLCTLGLVCPDEIALQLGTILRPCCQAMRNVRDCDEKEVGFRGMCELVVRNPTALIADFIYFCDAVASWNTIKPDLKEIIRNILLSVKQQCGEDWLYMYEQFPLMLRARLEVLRCPENLIAPLIKIVIDEIRKACKKHPVACGFNTSDEAYEPLKLMQCVMAKTNEVCLRYLDNSMLCSLPSPGPPYNIVSVYALKNLRRKMEDRHVVIHDLNTMFNIQQASPSSYYAVFDGHAGHDAAAYSSAHLHQFLAESKYFINNPEQALIDAFCKTDALFIDKCRVEKLSSGTTAVCALLRPKEKTLYIAWAGDSQALLVNQDEKNRIEEQGGLVIYWGTWRVNGQLAVSRAIGDAEYKPYVTAIPDVQEIPLSGDEDFLILACDGLWDFLSEDDAACAVYNMVADNPVDEVVIYAEVRYLRHEVDTHKLGSCKLFMNPVE